jgi:hypothetical protein
LSADKALFFILVSFLAFVGSFFLAALWFNQAETYQCLRFSTTQTGLAVVTGPAFADVVVGEVADVDPAQGMNGLAALAAGDQGFLFVDPIALI